MQLIECVPNVSEGRDGQVIAALREAITAVEGVRLLDTHSDADHNRTVFTFAGAPRPVTAAAFRLIAAAAQHIDLRTHSGQHPRIGAADVVPLVPLRDIDRVETAGYARQLGDRVARDLALPVYYYDDAHPAGRSLPQTRRKGYEWLRQAIHTEHVPDMGPQALGPAGAVAIGVRDLLVAFNVFLATDDVSVAQAIAWAVRESSGGMAGVRALGMQVAGRAQVSMNLITPRRVGPTPVVARIRELAAQHGTAVERSELVGLIPEVATAGHATWDLHPPLTDDRVLERALRGRGLL